MSKSIYGELEIENIVKKRILRNKLFELKMKFNVSYDEIREIIQDLERSQKNE